jgi:hypothetical protein
MLMTDLYVLFGLLNFLISVLLILIWKLLSPPAIETGSVNKILVAAAVFGYKVFKLFWHK